MQLRTAQINNKFLLFYGGKIMSTLVVYATKHGSTGKCSEMLSEKIKGKVDLFNLKDGRVPELSGYDKVIIGGSIYAGRIQKEVTEFCIKNLSTLKEKKIGLFICCMFQKSAEVQLNSSFPQELQKIAVARESFGGEMKFSEFNFFEKAITKMVSKMVSRENSDMPVIDMSKDLSMISEERINKFARIMNNV